MLHHIELYVTDIEATHGFWSELLKPLGYHLESRWKDGFTLRRSEGTYITFVQSAEKYREFQFHRCGVGLNHIAFQTENRDQVDSLRKYCQDIGATILYDERFPDANAIPEYYALFIEDPDRIKIEFVAPIHNLAK